MVSAWDLIGSTSYSYFFAPKGKCFSADQNQPPPAGSKACHRKRYHKLKGTKCMSLLCFPLRRWEGFQRKGISEISSPVSIFLFSSPVSILLFTTWTLGPTTETSEDIILPRLSCFRYYNQLWDHVTNVYELPSKRSKRQKRLNHFLSLKVFISKCFGQESIK